MAEAKLRKISVTIAGREYPVRVQESEVDMIVRIARDINKKLQDLQLQYNKNDLQDCMSMTLLTYAVEAYQKRPKAAADDNKELLSQFNRIDEVLDSILRS